MAESHVSTSALTWWHTLLSSQRQLQQLAQPFLLQKVDCLMDEGRDSMPLRDFVVLLEEIGRCHGDSAISWLAGHSKLFDLDTDFGRAVLGSRTLGSALHWLHFYYPLLQDSTSVSLDIEGDWASFSYRILDPTIWPRHQDALFTMGIIAHMIKTAAPEAWAHTTMTVEADAEGLLHDQSSIIQAELIYGGQTNTLRFPAAILNRELNLTPEYDSDALKRLTRELTQRQRSTAFTLRCRDTIFEELGSGHVGQDRVARELGVSSRTLRRKLAAEDLSFQSLLDECRMQAAALEFQKESSQSLSDMALKLGYSEHSTFSRAFQRWSGVAPNEYRRAVTMH